MSRFIRTLSFRRKKDRVPESSKPHQWQEDERKVRDGTCSFQVRYLGCIEVFESRGMQVCEEAVKALKAKKHRSVWSRMSLRSRKKAEQSKGKYQRAILYVSGDALRVVDEISKGLIVDQTIEKVSFCAPDRNHEKGFAYICRDGTTRRWMCHAFLAVKESTPPSRWKRFKHDAHSVTGERLSHAVGCAFAVCLEKKQKREKDAVQVQFNEKGTSFSRTGSFRQTTLTERLADPQSAIVAEPVPVKPIDNIAAVQRPRASEEMLIRQGSFRGFSKLNENSPFKRQFSLRLDELPSTIERQQALNGPAARMTVAPIPEVSPTKENEEASISAMCQELTQGLNALSTDDPFARAPGPAGPRPSGTTTASSIPQPGAGQSYNPWGDVSTGSEAEAWLHHTASAVGASLVDDPYIAGAVPYNPVINGTSRARFAGHGAGAGTQVPATQQVISRNNVAVSSAPPAQKPPPLGQLRSRTIDTSTPWQQNQQKAPTLKELSQRNRVMQFQSQTNGSVTTTTWQADFSESGSNDPFDVTWAAKNQNKTPASKPTPNPFDDQVTESFKVNL